MGISMGLGAVGNAAVSFKRRFRWKFEIFGICGSGSVPADFVKLAARPNISIEETEINHLNSKYWIPGKATWETISVTYYDVAGDANLGLWNWLAAVFNFTDSTNSYQGNSLGEFSANGFLELFNGCGESQESWLLKKMWPTAINFGELDYANSEEMNVELTLRYAEVDYNNLCGTNPVGCCTSAC